MSSWDDVTTEREKPETTKRPREAKEGKESTPSSSKKVRSGFSIQSEDSHLPEQEDSTNLFIQNQSSSSSSSSSFLSSQPNNPLNAIEQDIRGIQTGIEKTESSIDETALEIKKTTTKIEQLEEEIKTTTDPDEKNRLLDEKKQLREDKKQLRNKEEQLRKEKKQLRDRLAEKEKQIAIAPPEFDLLTPESIIESMKRVSERIPGLQFRTPEEMFKPNKLISPYFQNFIDREDALTAAITALSSEDIGDEEPRTRYPLVATAAGSGTGKSRFCDELAMRLANQSERILPIPISYNGYTKQLDFDMDAEKALILRVLYMSFFCVPISGNSWKKFLDLFVSASDLSLFTAMDAIFRHSKASRAVLLIDEISKSPDLADTLTAAVDVMDDSTPAKTLRVFVTSLDGKYGGLVTGSNRSITPIKLDLLKNTDVFTYLLNDPFWKLPVPSIAVKLACGHPRLLKSLHRQNQSNFTSLDTLIANTGFAMQDLPIDFVDLRVALLGMKIKPNDKLISQSETDYSHYLRESYFMDPDGTSKKEEGRGPFYPQIPLLPLLRLAKEQSSLESPPPVAKTIYQMITTVTSQGNIGSSTLAGKPYELFHALWEVMVRQLVLLKPVNPALFPLDRPYDDHYKSSTNNSLLYNDTFRVAEPLLLQLPNCNSVRAFLALLAKPSSAMNAINQTDNLASSTKVNLHQALKNVKNGKNSVILRFGANFPGIDLLIFDACPSVPGGVKITGDR